MSVSSQGPPISLYNRSFGTHHWNNSSTSSSFVAMLNTRYGANSGMAAWTRHCKEVSVDSVMSNFSGMHLGCPGLGDKMFNNPADLGPLTSISASPPESAVRLHVGNCSSFDSIIYDEQRLSQEDSLFEKTHNCSSMSSDSVFGNDYHFQNGLLPPNQFRPLSVCSISSIHSPMKEDDTMISVSSIALFLPITKLTKIYIYYRCSEEDMFVIDQSLIEASPCVLIEKRKHSAAQGIQIYNGQDDPYD